MNDTLNYSLDSRVNRDAVEKVLKRYAKRLTALGQPEPTWSYVAEGSRVNLTVTGVPPVTSHVIAACDTLRDDDGKQHTLIRAFPGKGEYDLSGFREAELRCDHCGLRRHRIQTFIVKQPDTGDLMMVGSTCVDEYTDREGTLAVWQALAQLNAAFIEFENFEPLGPDEGYGYGSSGGAWDLSVRHFTAAAACAIRHFGWHKSAEEAPTKHDALAIYMARKYDDVPRVEQRDLDEADAALAWAFDQLEYARTRDNDYLYNLATLSQMAQVPIKFQGILASLPFAYQRNLARGLERKAEQEATLAEPLAADKTRVRDLPVTIMDTRWFDGAYGSTLLIKMRDEAGHRLAWFASSCPVVEIGDEAIITGTVKEYDAERGETKLTRCNLTIKEPA